MPKIFQKSGIAYVLGLNATDNWKILAASEKSWWWVHLAGDTPSAHVIIQSELEPIQAELDFARELILNQTPKASRSSEIVWAQVKRLRRGNKVGEVLIRP